MMGKFTKSSLTLLFLLSPLTQSTFAESNPAKEGPKATPQITKAGPLEKKTTWVSKDRTAGTITLRPLTVNVSGLTFGMLHKSQVINGWNTDPYKKSFATLSNQAQAIGASYDFEMGIMVTSNVELFAIGGFEYQRRFTKVKISNNNSAPFGQFDVLAYDFETRRNYGFSFGGRYYWNTQKPWFPFVGLMGTVTRQGAIRAKAYDIGPNGYVPTYPYIGKFTLQPAKTLWGGTLQAGADYQFTDLVSMSFVTGIQYSTRAPKHFITIVSPAWGPKLISCKDNRNLWSIPIMVALKFTL